MSILGSRKTAIVTEKALREGSIGFAYTALSRESGDTGWRFLYDSNEASQDTSDPDKIYICEMRRLQEYFPYLDSLKGKGNYERRNGQWFTVPELPPNCRLPRKTRMNDGMVGFAVTVDPEDMRELKKGGMKEWELLLPQNRED